MLILHSNSNKVKQLLDTGVHIIHIDCQSGLCFFIALTQTLETNLRLNVLYSPKTAAALSIVPYETACFSKSSRLGNFIIKMDFISSERSYNNYSVTMWSELLNIQADK